MTRESKIKILDILYNNISERDIRINLIRYNRIDRLIIDLYLEDDFYNDYIDSINNKDLDRIIESLLDRDLNDDMIEIENIILDKMNHSINRDYLINLYKNGDIYIFHFLYHSEMILNEFHYIK